MRRRLRQGKADGIKVAEALVQGFADAECKASDIIEPDADRNGGDGRSGDI